MATSTVNDQIILNARIHEPRVGVWHADVETETSFANGESVTMIVEGSTFVGTVRRGGDESGRWLGRIVGGADGLGLLLAAKAYVEPTFGILLDEMATATGETLSSSIPTDVRSFRVARWYRSRALASHALWSIVDALNAGNSPPGYIWRIQRDGTLTIEVDSFTTADGELIEEGAKPSLGEHVIAPLAAPFIRPGIGFAGAGIDRVVTEVVASSLRQRYWTV